MLMQKYILFIWIMLLGLAGCSKDQSYQIEGKLTHLQDPTVYVVFESENGKVIDTVVCETEGKFKVQQKTGDFNTATLFFENRSRVVNVFLEKGKKVSIEGDITYPKLLEIEGGSSINKQLTALRRGSANLWKEQEKLLTQIDRKAKHPIEEADLIAKLTNINHQLEEEAVAYIKKNTDKAVSLALIQYFFTNPDDSRETDELLALITPELRDHFLYRELEEYSARTKRTNIGAEAPDFHVKNVYGQEFKLDTVKNKYTLLAFVPSWEGKTKLTDPYMVQIAKKHPARELNMLVITIDNNCNQIRDYLKTDSISWNLVADSVGQVTALMDLYNVSELPLCYLIDKDRKILLKSENNLEVKDVLDELLEE